MAEQLGASHPAFLVSTRDSQGDLHYQCHWIIEHVAT